MLAYIPAPWILWVTLPTLAAFQVSPGSRSVPPPPPPTPPAATPAPAARLAGRYGRCGPGVRPTRPRPPHSWRWRVTWAMANGDSCSNLRQNDTEWNWEGYILCVWHSKYIYVHIIYRIIQSICACGTIFMVGVCQTLSFSGGAVRSWSWKILEKMGTEPTQAVAQSQTGKHVELWANK